MTYTWTIDAISIFLRYFIPAGILYWIFYRYGKEKFAGRKIQRAAPSSHSIRREILFSITTLIIYAMASALVFYCWRKGYTKIYADIDELGFAYWFISIVIMVFIHDAYFYWTHRIMHHRALFKIIHQIHHRSNNPTPWAAFAFHPLEAVIATGIIPIIIFVMPCHPLAIAAFLSWMSLINVLGHLGFETLPAGIRTSIVGKYLNTATCHNEHHMGSRGNYGLYFTIWDRVMGTYNGCTQFTYHQAPTGRHLSAEGVSPPLTAQQCIRSPKGATHSNP